MPRALRIRPGPVPRDLAGALDRLVDGALVDAGVREEALAVERTRAAVLAYELTEGHPRPTTQRTSPRTRTGTRMGTSWCEPGYCTPLHAGSSTPLVRDHWRSRRFFSSP